MLGFEQILAGDYNVAKFPAPGEWYVALSVADSDISPAEHPGRAAVELEVTVEGDGQASSPDFAAKLARPDAGTDRGPRRRALLGGRRGRRAARR